MQNALSPIEVTLSGILRFCQVLHPWMCINPYSFNGPYLNSKEVRVWDW